MEIAFLIGKLLFGGYFIMNGINHFKNKGYLAGYAQSKHIPSPEFAVLLSGAILLVSGVCVIIELFAPIALLALVGFLIVVSFTMHNFWKIEDKQAKAMEQIQFMKNMALVGACLMLLSIESWSALI